MKIFGDKMIFAIEYDLDCPDKYDIEEAELKVYINSKSVCTFKRTGTIYEFKWDIKDIAEWLEVNLGRILEEEEDFPLPVEGKTAVELYQNSCDFESDDEAKFDDWYDKRHEWIYDHSWLSSRAGGYLANLNFRKVAGTIEISWNNLKLYSEEGIEFLNPVGVFYVEIDYLKRVIHSFVETFKNDIQSIILRK
jgi:hypothetical protein